MEAYQSYFTLETHRTSNRVYSNRKVTYDYCGNYERVLYTIHGPTKISIQPVKVSI